MSAYSVISTVDSVDVTIGNGVANDASGNATLRAAVMDANATAGADTITLGAGVFKLTIGGKGENAAATGDLDVTGNLTIEGAGTGQTILDAATLDRFFHVLSGGTLTLRNVTIRNGRETNGGGIENDGTLILENVDLTGNVTTARGGAIYNNTGRLTMTSVNVFGNTSSDVVSGQGSAIGGGLASFGGTVTISASTFTNNVSAGDGGGIDSRSTTLLISNSTFQNNSATVGGAVRLFNGSAALTNNSFNGDHALTSGGAIASNICALTIDGGSFTGNYLSPPPTAAAARTGGSLALVGVNAASPAVSINGVTFTLTGSGDGGAIYNNNARLNVSNSLFDRVTGRTGGAINNTSGGTLVMVNTTIAGGTAGLGGAIYNTATVQMTNSTITGNTSTGQAATASAAVANSGSFTSINNIIAGNVNGADVIGTFISLGGNLVGRGAGSTGFSQSTDQMGTAQSPINPLLSPLANNGGPVATMAISAQSPARDAGVAGGPATDVRGLPRTADPIDIGAFEYQNHLPVAGPFSVSSNEDQDFTGQLAATDDDGDALTFQLLTSPGAGQLLVQADGSFHYIPAADVFGTFTFRYRATDGRGFSNNVDAQIVVLPVNDAPTMSDQSFIIVENSAAGTIVGTVEADDIDSTNLILDIVSGNESGAFELDPETGDLVVADASKLNFETTPTFTLVVRVADDGSPLGTALATVTVHVTDANDAPLLGAPSYTVDEMAANGTVVGMIPFTDEDAQQSFSYEIIGGDIPGAFAIDPSTGEITVIDGMLLDYETDNNVLVRVRVTDHGTPTFVRDTVVTVNLNDVNDAPTISDQTFFVPENAELGYFIGQISVSDVDSTNLAIEIVSGNADGAFSVTLQNGLIFVANSNPLNFEANPTFSFVVRVTDDGVPVGSSEASITVHVTDVNEAPLPDSSTLTIDENSDNGTVVGVVAASDVDNGQTLTYEIVGDAGPFVIDPTTGVIAVADGTALDYEGQSTYSLLIRVTDNGTPALSGDAVVTINLNDVNDAPELARDSFSVDENSANGTLVGTVSGTDQDVGQSLTYSILLGNADGAFSIDPVSGQIVVANSAALDFEASPSYTLIVMVADDGSPSLTTTALVTISLVDINELPQIGPQSVSVAENSANGTTVGAVSATDPDAGQSLTYSIVSGNADGAFAIDPTTGEITVANATALNFEATPTFSLVISVADNGSPVLSSTAIVTISLQDQNEAPVAESSTFTVDENSAGGTIVGVVAASDVDGGQSLTYEIVGDAGPFVIDPATGTITVATGAGIDFEAQSTYSLVVRVTDNGTPALATDATVVINVNDVNEAPHLENQSVAVADRSANGTGAGTVVGSDPDAGQTLTYSIVGGNIDGAFSIDPTTGQIVVANSLALNFGLHPLFSLTVMVTDNGVPQLSDTAVVTISLVNTNSAPEMADQSFTVAENAENGATVGVVAASDPDLGQFLTYAIVSGNADGAFAINASTGKITVANSSVLNFELVTSFSLVVSVEDSADPSLSATATVTISLQDLNEAPSIESRTFSISENAANGTVVGSVKGSDPDAGQSLTYSIAEGNANGAFAINAVTGQITVANVAALNFESVAKFTLTVKVKDNGLPSRSATATVSINLSNVNEAPQIGEKSFSIDEKSANGTVVGTVTASDPDAGQTLSFAIDSGNGDGAFAIDAATGQITVANSALLVFATTPKFTLKVRVTDNGSPALSSTATVTVSLKAVTPPSSIVVDVGLGDSTNTLQKGRTAFIAILSSAKFDVRSIDVGTLRFGKTGAENSLVRTCRGIIDCCYRDVNRDGRVDLILQVTVNSTGLQVGDTQAKLTGKQRNGQAFSATSSVVVQNQTNRRSRSR